MRMETQLFIIGERDTQQLFHLVAADAAMPPESSPTRTKMLASSFENVQKNQNRPNY